MKYVSIDIETTGIDNETTQTLSIGLVVEDTENVLPIEDLPKLEIGIIRDRLEGEIFALNMNRDLISDILRYKMARSFEEQEAVCKETGREYMREEDAAKRIFHFLWDNQALDGEVSFDANHMVEVVHRDGVAKTYPSITSKMKPFYFNAAGKNFGSFDQKFLERLPRWKQIFRIRNRILDPAILYVDWKGDESLPGLSKCKERAGLNSHVTHNAIDDALDVVVLLRKQYA